ncbi:hypothetical protein PIB30_064334 [Stylosanthes scabra]|uniref:Uncharacterized protein n=1 Tax=Stylosanthes scabra TaxID=79078 RepID=A0ABU6XMG6_9FABA|nr:hypothetical protein [Stylosanthes scabra]
MEKTEVGNEKISPKNLRKWAGRADRVGSKWRVGPGRGSGCTDTWKDLCGFWRETRIIEWRHVSRSEPWKTEPDPTAAVSSGEKNKRWAGDLQAARAAADGGEAGLVGLGAARRRRWSRR